MTCPKCQHPKSKTLNTRSTDHAGESLTKRHRKCAACDHRFVTWECYEPSDPESSFEASDLRAVISKTHTWLQQARRIPIVRSAIDELGKHLT